MLLRSVILQVTFLTKDNLIYRDKLLNLLQGKLYVQRPVSEPGSPSFSRQSTPIPSDTEDVDEHDSDEEKEELNIKTKPNST